jgi:hypothetical protein
MSDITPLPAPTFYDVSTTIKVAGQAVSVFAFDQTVTGFMLQNIDTTEALWWSITGTATAATLGSFVLPPIRVESFSAMFVTPLNFRGSGVLSVVAKTAGHKVSCVYW